MSYLLAADLQLNCLYLFIHILIFLSWFKFSSFLTAAAYFILLVSIVHNAHCNWCHQYSLWQKSSIDRSKLRTEQRISYKRTAFSRFFVHSVWSLEVPSSTRGSVLSWRCRCPITVPGRQGTRRGSSVPRTGRRCRVAFLFLGEKKKWLVQEGSKSPVSVINSWWIQLISFRRQVSNIEHCSFYKPRTVWKLASRIYKVQNIFLRWVVWAKFEVVVVMTVKVAVFMSLQKATKISPNSVFSFLRPMALWPLSWSWCPPLSCCHLRTGLEMTK